MPLIGNFFINIFIEDKDVMTLNFYDYVSSFLIFLFLYSLGVSLKNIFPKLTIVFGIITYLISFYIFEILGLFINKEINFNFVIVVVNMVWIIYLVYSLNNKKLLILNFLSYGLLFSFNRYFLNNLSSNKNITGDVYDVFFPYTSNLYNNGLYSSIAGNQSWSSGYPHFTSYLDALLFKLTFNLESYLFFSSTSFLYFWLFILLFSELNLNKINKSLITLIFTILVLNSDWLQFLFLTSLMSERVSIFLFLGPLVCLFKQNDNKTFEFKLIYFILSFAYLTKHFFTILVLIIFIIFIFNNFYRKSSAFLLSAFLLKELTYLTYFRGLPRDLHTSTQDIPRLLQDVILFRNLKFENIYLIIKNVLIDLPMSYVILLLIMMLFFRFTFVSWKDYKDNIYVAISFLNLIFVFLLYISIWQHMELESPVRYIYNYLPIYLILIFNSIEKIQTHYK